MVLVPTMHVGCSNDAAEFKYKTGKVLVPTMHVGCSMILGISLQNTLEF